MCNTQSFRPAWTDDGKVYNTIKCPKCGYPQFCGCSACKDKIPEGMFPYKWNTILYSTELDNSGYLGGGQIEVLICANCGFEASIDWWVNGCINNINKDRQSK